MPWKRMNSLEQRFDLVVQMARGRMSVKELCRRFSISRQTAYKWRGRYRKGRLRGLRDQSRRPLRSRLQTTVAWLRRVRRARLRRPTWGARKLRHQLTGSFGEKKAPSTATISRWLKRWGLARGKRRRRRGPVVLRKALHIPS